MRGFAGSRWAEGAKTLPAALMGKAGVQHIGWRTTSSSQASGTARKRSILLAHLCPRRMESFWASALQSDVLPVPGGPWSSTTLPAHFGGGGRAGQGVGPNNSAASRRGCSPHRAASRSRGPQRAAERPGPVRARPPVPGHQVGVHPRLAEKQGAGGVLQQAGLDAGLVVQRLPQPVKLPAARGTGVDG